MRFLQAGVRFLSSITTLAIEQTQGLSTHGPSCPLPFLSFSNNEQLSSGLDYRKDDIIRVAQQLLSKLPR
jgi:hypothetical protein